MQLNFSNNLNNNDVDSNIANFNNTKNFLSLLYNIDKVFIIMIESGFHISDFHKDKESSKMLI